MLQGAPDAAYLEEARAAGMPVAGPAEVPVWAEHAVVVCLFAAMRTQWVMDAFGVPALNLAALPVVEQRMGITSEQAASLFDDLLVMQAEARRWFQARHAGTLH